MILYLGLRAILIKLNCNEFNSGVVSETPPRRCVCVFYCPQCSAECGVGSQQRAVVCLVRAEEGYAAAPPYECSSLDRPLGQQSCNLGPCGAKWYHTDWSAVSTPRRDTGTRVFWTRDRTGTGGSSGPGTGGSSVPGRGGSSGHGWEGLLDPVEEGLLDPG